MKRAKKIGTLIVLRPSRHSATIVNLTDRQARTNSRSEGKRAMIVRIQTGAEQKDRKREREWKIV